LTGTGSNAHGKDDEEKSDEDDVDDDDNKYLPSIEEILSEKWKQGSTKVELSLERTPKKFDRLPMDNGDRLIDTRRSGVGDS